MCDAVFKEFTRHLIPNLVAKHIIEPLVEYAEVEGISLAFHGFVPLLLDNSVVEDEGRSVVPLRH